MPQLAGQRPTSQALSHCPQEGIRQAGGGSPEPTSSGKFLVMRQLQGQVKQLVSSLGSGGPMVKQSRTVVELEPGILRHCWDRD